MYGFLSRSFPKLRVLGFDSISVSSFANRMIGRAAHKKFLNPAKPILLLKDMNLTNVCEGVVFDEVLIASLRIRESDGLPCTVVGFMND